jgi:hypothetical protein
VPVAVNENSSVDNGHNRSRWGGVVRSLLITAVLCLIAAEVGAALFVYTTEHYLPWLPSHRQQAAAEPDLPIAGNGALRISPYCGPIGRPGLHLADQMTRGQFESLFGQRVTEQSYKDLRFNNEGMISLRDYPFEDPAGEAFIVGIFGASVSSGFANTMEDTMNEFLHRDPRFAHRKVVLLNFGNSATRQPQNAACVAYFLSIGQHFDYLVNLDGFTEMFIGWLNANQYATDEIMPFAGTVFGIQNAVLESYGALAGDDRVARLRGRLNELQRQQHSPDFSLHAAWIEIRRRQLQKEWTELQKTLTATKAPDARNYAMPLAPRTSPDDAIVRDRVVSAWFNASVAIGGMAKAFHIPYLHMLMPNQYFTKAHFNDEERARLLNMTMAPVQKLVPEYYKEFERRGLELPAHGVDFFDATDLMDDSDASVFYDNCCHFTEKGNLIMAHAMADRILHGLDRFEANK